MLKKDNVFLNRVILCEVLCNLVFLFKVQFKWSWLDLTQGLSHVYVLAGCFLEQCFGSTLKSIWFPVCDQSEMSSQDTTRSLNIHTGNCLQTGWVEVMWCPLCLGWVCLWLSVCYCYARAYISFKKQLNLISARAWGCGKSETELETRNSNIRLYISNIKLPSD